MCRAILDSEGHERLDEGRNKTTAGRNKRITFYHRCQRPAIPPSPLVKSRVYRTARERERVGNRAINNYRMKKGARYPPGAPKPRLHTPRHPLPPLIVPAPYKPRTGRPRQLYPRTRNVLLPWRRMLAYAESVCAHVNQYTRAAQSSCRFRCIRQLPLAGLQKLTLFQLNHTETDLDAISSTTVKLLILLGTFFNVTSGW